MGDRIRVYLAGPIQGDDAGLTAMTRAYTAVMVAQSLVDHGFAPLVPQLTVYWPDLIGKDNDHATWLDIDLPWVSVADCLLRLPGASKGADIEEGWAKGKGIPVFHDIDTLIEKGAQWRSDAEGATRSSHSPSSMPTTAVGTAGAGGVNPAMRPPTRVGSVPTTRRSLDTTNAGTNAQERDSLNTGSPVETTTGCSPLRAGSVQSVAAKNPSSLEANCGLSPSTTTPRADVFEVFSVRPVIQESASSTTILLGLELPPGTAIHPQSYRFYELLGELARLHALKGRDYGHGQDPFANVRASSEWGVPPWVGALVRLTDKVRRLQTFARTHHLSNEGAQDSLLDISVYSLIASILLDETQLDEASETE